MILLNDDGILSSPFEINIENIIDKAKILRFNIIIKKAGNVIYFSQKHFNLRYS